MIEIGYQQSNVKSFRPFQAQAHSHMADAEATCTFIATNIAYTLNVILLLQLGSSK